MLFRSVALLEQRTGQTQYHIINNWLYLGSVSKLEDARSLCSTTPGFDSDGYKILCKPMLTGKLPVMLVPKA